MKDLSMGPNGTFYGSRGNVLWVTRERSIGHEETFDESWGNVHKGDLQGHRTVLSSYWYRNTTPFYVYPLKMKLTHTEWMGRLWKKTNAVITLCNTVQSGMLESEIRTDGFNHRAKRYGIIIVQRGKKGSRRWNLGGYVIRYNNYTIQCTCT